MSLGAAPAHGVGQQQQTQPPAPPEWDGSSTPEPVRPPVTRKESELDRALRENDLERAERLLVAQIERKPNSPELLKTLAGVFMKDRKPLNAAIAIKKAEALGPLDNQTRFQLALAYVALKQRDWARPELQRLDAADPSNPIYEYWLGRLDYDDGRYDSAIRHLRRVVEREPQFMRAYDNLGLCYEALNQPEVAMSRYRDAIRLNRDTGEQSPWPPLNLGILLRSRGEIEEAESLFREALTYDQHFVRAHYQLGALLEQADRLAEAVNELEAATADPSYAEPHYALARIYRRQGRRREADAALATFQRLHEASREARQ